MTSYEHKKRLFEILNEKIVQIRGRYSYTVHDHSTSAMVEESAKRDAKNNIFLQLERYIKSDIGTSDDGMKHVYSEIFIMSAEDFKWLADTIREKCTVDVEPIP